jgi:mono/diheme cytochrome c family protein
VYDAHAISNKLKGRRAMRTIAVLAACALSFAAVEAAAQATKSAAKDPAVARGRYLVKIAGCNDCHTPGYPQQAGKVPEAEWLTGVPTGFSGPWGTTYAVNLRLLLNSLSEAQWMTYARKETRPPMPWFNLRDMTDQDVRAIYRYVKAMGPAGKPAPAYLPPGQKPTTPYIDFGPSGPPK